MCRRPAMFPPLHPSQRDYEKRPIMPTTPMSCADPQHPTRRRAARCTLLTLAATLCLTSSACTVPYKSMYKETQRSPAGPVDPAKVNVARSREAVDKPVTEIGTYRGQAPTTVEAIEGAQRECGRHGADFFILNTPPFSSEGVWKVDGVCARSS